MLSFKKRLQTFAGWPKNLSTKPKALAEAGFTFVGPLGGKNSQVRCAECNYSLNFNRYHTKIDPWECHASIYPPCSFVVAEKGDEFVARQSMEVARRKGWQGSISIPEMQEFCEAAGLELDYDKLFEDCKTYQDRVDKLVMCLNQSWLHYGKMEPTDANLWIIYRYNILELTLKGKPTLEKCRKIKTELEKWRRMMKQLLSGQESEESEQSEQESEQSEQESEEESEHESEEESEQESEEESEQESEQESEEESEEESEQSEQESEHSEQKSQQGGQERAHRGPEKAQSGQESEPSRQEGKQLGRKRQANRTNTFQAKKSCPDPETPKPSDRGHCSAKTDQPNLGGKGKPASAKPPQNPQKTSSTSFQFPCKLCSKEPVDIAKHYLDHHNIRDPSSMLVTDRTFLIPTGENQHCDSTWFSIQFVKAMERYTNTVCRLCDRDLRHQLNIEVHYIGYHNVVPRFLVALKQLIRKDGV